MFPRRLPPALTVLLVALCLTLPAAAQAATPVPDAPAPTAVGANYPPIVNASIVPRRVVYLDAGSSAGVQLMADATASADPEGQALLWSSDVNGDGSIVIAGSDTADGSGRWMKGVVKGEDAVEKWLGLSKYTWIASCRLAKGGRAGIAFEDAERGLLFAYDPGAATGNYWAVAVVDARTYKDIRRDPVLVDIDGLPAIGYGPYSLQFAIAR